MQRDVLRDSLVALRLDPRDYDALKALPLLYVAWAEGQVDSRAARKVLEISRQTVIVAENVESAITGWLRRRPSERYFLDGMRLLRRLAELPDELHIGPEDLQWTVVHCEQVARATSDGTCYISGGQQQALRRVTLCLGVDGGRSWSEILAELERTDGPPRQEEFPLPVVRRSFPKVG